MPHTQREPQKKKGGKKADVKHTHTHTLQQQQNNNNDR